MKYLNTNNHYVYVDDPDDDKRDLTPIKPGGEVNATGRFADNLDETSGVFRASSDEAKSFKSGDKADDGETKYPPNADEILATDGARSFPAEEQQIQTPEAARATREAQSVADAENAGLKFSSKNAEQLADAESLSPSDLEGRGSGKDGAITVKDVKALVAERNAQAGGDLEQLDDEGLYDLASEYGVDTDALLEDVEDADRREKLVAAIEEAQGDATQTTGTVTSDKVPAKS